MIIFVNSHANFFNTPLTFNFYLEAIKVKATYEAMHFKKYVNEVSGRAPNLYYNNQSLCGYEFSALPVHCHSELKFLALPLEMENWHCLLIHASKLRLWGLWDSLVYASIVCLAEIRGDHRGPEDQTSG